MKNTLLQKIRAKPFSLTSYYPVTGLGGHTVRIDKLYLIGKAHQYAISAWFITVAGLVNNVMTMWVARKIVIIMNNCVLLATDHSRSG